MRTLKEIRKANIARMMDEFQSQAAAADSAGISRQRLNSIMLGHTACGDRIARRLEEAWNLPPNWLDRGLTTEPDTAGLDDEDLLFARQFARLTPGQRRQVITLMSAMLSG